MRRRSGSTAKFVPTAFATAALAFGSCVGGALAGATPAYAQDDPLVDWQHEVTKALQAQEISQGEGVTIAIADTGVSPHPYLEEKNVVDGLAAKHVLEGIDEIDREEDCGPSWGRDESEPCIGDERVDTNGHGTAMAGVALSVAPKAALMPLKFLQPDDDGVTCASDTLVLVEQINWALENDVDVISMSFGLGCDVPQLRAALQRAVENDVVLIASAGNEGGTVEDSKAPYPDLYPGVIVVSATDPNNDIVNKPKYHWASTTGEQVALAAPGVDYTSLKNQVAWKETADGGIDFNDDQTLYEHHRTSGGTSSATAFVAGVAALVRAEHPDLNADQVVHRMLSTAQDLGEPGRDASYGYGLVDAYAAVTADVEPVKDHPLGHPLGAPGDPADVVAGNAAEPSDEAGGDTAASDDSESGAGDDEERQATGEAGGSAAGWGFAGVALVAAAAAVFFFLTRRPIPSVAGGPSFSPPRGPAAGAYGPPGTPGAPQPGAPQPAGGTSPRAAATPPQAGAQRQPGAPRPGAQPGASRQGSDPAPPWPGQRRQAQPGASAPMPNSATPNDPAPGTPRPGSWTPDRDGRRSPAPPSTRPSPAPSPRTGPPPRPGQNPPGKHR